MSPEHTHTTSLISGEGVPGPRDGLDFHPRSSVNLIVM